MSADLPGGGVETGVERGGRHSAVTREPVNSIAQFLLALVRRQRRAARTGGGLIFACFLLGVERLNR